EIEARFRGRRALWTQSRGIDDFGTNPFRHPDEERQPAGSRAKSSPDVMRQGGAIDLAKEVERLAIPLWPTERVRQVRAATEPAAIVFARGERHDQTQSCALSMQRMPLRFRIL